MWRLFVSCWHHYNFCRCGHFGELGVGMCGFRRSCSRRRGNCDPDSGIWVVTPCNKIIVEAETADKVTYNSCDLL